MKGSELDTGASIQRSCILSRWRRFISLPTSQAILPLIRFLAVVTAVIGVQQDSHVDLSAMQPTAAGSARVDIQIERGELQLPFLSPPMGTCHRMDWVGADVTKRTLTAEVPIVDFDITRFKICFTVSEDCEMSVALLGPWEQGEGGSLRELTVDWQAATRTGNVIEGFRPGTAWHDRRIELRCRANRGELIELEFAATVPEALRVQGGWRPAANSPAHELAKKFRRGINLSNFLEVPPGENWGNNTIRAEDSRAISAEGFDHVRIPVGWHHYCGPGPDYTISDFFSQRLAEQLDLASEAGLNAIVNVHHFHEFTEHPAAERTRLLAIWKQVAAMLKDRPDSVAFEILNEPQGNASTEIMNDFYAEVIPEIRKLNPARAIFVGPGSYNQVQQLGRLRLPADDRLIVTVHTYAPHYFTHQGAAWSADCGILPPLVFPGPPGVPANMPVAASPAMRDWLDAYNRLEDAANPCSLAVVQSEVQLAGEWGRHWNRPVHLGEFGAILNADADSRAAYCAALRTECERQGMGWCLWDWKAGFNYWNPAIQAPQPGLREALFPTSSRR